MRKLFNDTPSLTLAQRVAFEESLSRAQAQAAPTRGAGRVPGSPVTGVDTPGREYTGSHAVPRPTATSLLAKQPLLTTKSLSSIYAAASAARSRAIGGAGTGSF